MKKKIKLILVIIIPVLLVSLVIFYFIFFNKKEIVKSNVEFLDVNEQWADSLLSQMTIEEKIGQLVMLSSEQNSELTDSLLFYIENYNIGGAFVYRQSLGDYSNIKNVIQNKSKIPLLIGLRTENLSLNFINDLPKYPLQKAIFSASKDTLQKLYAHTVAKQCSELGVHINFLNLYDFMHDSINFDTTIANFYYEKAKIYTEYLLQNKILSSIDINKLAVSDTGFRSVEIEMYKDLFNSGLSAITYRNYKHEEIENLKFEGITFKYYTEKTDYETFFENNYDILILENNYEEIIQKLIKTSKSKRKYEKAVNEKVKKILLAKTWLDLNKNTKINLDSAKINTNSLYHKLFCRKLQEKSITLIQNKDGLIPIKNIKNDFQVVTLGKNKLEFFEKSISYYKSCSYIHLNPEEDNLEKRFKIYANNIGIIVLNNHSLGIEELDIMNAIIEKNKLIIVNFGNTENIAKLIDFPVVIQVYDTTEVEQSFSAQLIFGGISAEGKLPFLINEDFKFQQGVKTLKTRLKYTIPEEVGIDSKKLAIIDSIIEEGIRRGATPGCQVFIAKQGRVLLNKGYGYHTYGKGNRVENTDLYDVASVTKIAATTLSAMKMVETGLLDLNSEIGKYFDNTHIEYTRIKPDTILNIDTLNLNEIKNINKILKYQDTIHLNDSIIVAYDTLIIMATPKLNIFKVTARDLLRHESGLLPAMPILRFLLWRQEYNKYVEHFNLSKDSIGINDTVIQLDSLNRRDSIPNHKKTSKKLLSKREYYNTMYSNRFVRDSSEVQIAGGMYLNKRYQDTLWIDTKQLRAYSRKIYQYSDVNMILLQLVIDSINDYSLHKYTQKNFYAPLGLQCGYKPLERYNLKKIVPTERDNFWRNQLVHGHVHDPSAAMIGGISGNAGLFSSAWDLGVLFQMILNGGTYGSRRYLNKVTIDVFTKTQTDSYRGLGFDKWSKRQIIAKSASPNTYGHTGFTGCCVWVDPDSEIVYVFLSNRVHPSAKNWRLNSYKIRNNVHQAVYDAMF